MLMDHDNYKSNYIKQNNFDKAFNSSQCLSVSGLTYDSNGKSASVYQSRTLFSHFCQCM